jgi:hypothetical protein
LVFDYPSVAAITSLVASLGARGAAGASPPSFDDVSDDEACPDDTPAVLPPLAGAALGSGAAAGQGARLLVAVLSFASRTAAGNAVLSLEGRDASRRVPFERWSGADVEQVGAAPAWALVLRDQAVLTATLLP